jgi:hypothetical protein
VVVMANANGAMPLMDEVIRAAAAAHGWADWQAQPVPERLLKALATETLYLRGSMNNWGLGAPMHRLLPGRLELELELPAGAVQFKFAAEEWQRLDLGAAPAAPRQGPGSGLLTFGGPNIGYTVPTAGRYRVVLDVRDAAGLHYAITPVPGTPP